MGPLSHYGNGTTQTYWSLPVIISVVVISSFIALTIAWYALELIAGLGIATAWATNYIGMLQTVLSSFGTVILFSFAILFGLVIIKSFRLGTHPVLGLAGLIGVPVAVIGTGYASNAVAIFTGLDFLGNALNQFDTLLLFIKNSPTIVAIGSILVLFVMVGGGVLARR